MYTYSTHSNHKVKWSFLYHSGKPFPLNDYTLVVRIDTGRGSIMIKDEELVKGSNYIEIDLPAKKQVSGVYSLKAALYKGQTFTTEFRQPEAFLLSPLSADTSVNIDVVSYAEPLFSAKDEAEKAAAEVENWIGDNDIIPRFCKCVVDEDGNATYYTNVVRMTKEQYDAIEVKGQQTLYILYKEGEIDEIYLGEGRLSLGKEQVQEAIDTANRAYGAIESVISKAEVAEQAALDAAESAEQVRQKAESINSDVNDLKQAIADLPDGQAVSAKVAEHTAKISELEEEVSYKSTINKNIAVGYEDWNGGWVKPDGTILNNASQTSYRYSDKISVAKDANIMIKRALGTEGAVAIVASYTANDTFVPECSYSGDSISPSPLNINTEGYNIAYVRLTYKAGAIMEVLADVDGDSLTIKDKLAVIEESISENTTAISDNSSRIKAIEDLDVESFAERLSDIEDDITFDDSQYERINVCADTSNFLYGYIGSNGVLHPAQSGAWRYSDKIYGIKPNSLIEVVKGYGVETTAQVACYDKNDLFIPECSIVGAMSSKDYKESSIDGYEVAYIRVCYGGGIASPVIYAYIGESSVIDLKKKIKAIEDDFNEKIQETNERIESIGIINPWKGKTWLALGTSITDTNNTLAPDGTCTGKYVPYLKEMGEFGVFENRGVAGTVVGSHMLYYASHAAHLADADLVTIEGFVNDWAGSKKLGKVGDTIPYHVAWSSPIWDNGGNDETGSFAGAVYQALITLMANAPKAKIVLITDNTGQKILSTGANCARETLKNGLTQKDYTDMAISVAHYLGVEVINAGQDSQVNQNHPEYLIDQIHQTELGGKQFAKVIWSKLKNIQPIVID